MLNKKTAGVEIAKKGGQKGGMWGAHRLSAEQKNAAIKPKKKEKKSSK